MLGLAGGFSLSEGNLGGQIPWMSQGSLGLVGGWQASGEHDGHGNVHCFLCGCTPYGVPEKGLFFHSLPRFTSTPTSISEFLAMLADKHLFLSLVEYY